MVVLAGVPAGTVSLKTQTLELPSPKLPLALDTTESAWPHVAVIIGNTFAYWLQKPVPPPGGPPPPETVTVTDCVEVAFALSVAVTLYVVVAATVVESVPLDPPPGVHRYR
jgi:hypothetical protein